MTRIFTNPRFWVLAFLMSWLTMITVIIAQQP
jgi:hypothetical protein